MMRYNVKILLKNYKEIINNYSNGCLNSNKIYVHM